MSERYDVIVVGGGAMGTAAARNLAMRGRRTLLLERFMFGHDKGSSGGPTRIFRYAYHATSYVRMAMQARPAWDELQEAAGEGLLRHHRRPRRGPAPFPGPTLEAAATLSNDGRRARSETLAVARTARRRDIVYQPTAAWCGGADRPGAGPARRRGGCRRARGDDVRSVTPEGDRARVITETNEVLEAPSSWSRPDRGPRRCSAPRGSTWSRPNLEQATYFSLAPEHALPTVIDWLTDEAHPPYLVPDPFEPGHFKVGLHMAGPPTDAETRTFDPDPVRVEAVRRYVRERIEDAIDLDRTDTCLYTITPDEDFVLDRVGPLVIASPCSGHGFKFVPLFGQAIADLATGEPTPFPTDAFRADRAALQARLGTLGGEDLQRLAHRLVTAHPEEALRSRVHGADRSPALGGTAPSLGGEAHELGTRIGRIDDAPDVPADLELVDGQHHRLLRDTGALGEVGEPASAPPVHMEEHHGVTRTDVGVASIVEREVELGRDGAMRIEQQPSEVVAFHARILPHADHDGQGA